ncbi:MAG: hypothetical protein QM657_04700 [Lacrimispora sp.]|uniref:hypothetical protein n=1 Tax=Lacrimispora sp. TaxID=2719234 RepID=UPI0039E31FFF
MKKILAGMLAAALTVNSLLAVPVYGETEGSNQVTETDQKETENPETGEKSGDGAGGEALGTATASQAEYVKKATASEAAVVINVTYAAGDGIYQMEAEDGNLATSSEASLSGEMDRMELQSGGSVTYDLSKLSGFQAGTYLISVRMNGNTQAVNVLVDGGNKGTIVKADRGFGSGDLEEYYYHGTVELEENDTLSIKEAENKYGHLDWTKLERIDAPVYWLEAEDGSIAALGGGAGLHGDGDRAELNSGGNITFDLSKVSGFQPGLYQLYVGANGARSELLVTIDGIEQGTVSTPGKGRWEKGSCEDCFFDQEISLEKSSKIKLADTNGSWGHIDYIRLVKTADTALKFDETHQPTGIRITAEEGVLPLETQIEAKKLTKGEAAAIRDLFKEDGKKSEFYKVTLKEAGAEISLKDLAGEVTVYIPAPKGYSQDESRLYYMEDSDSEPEEVFFQWVNVYLKATLSEYGIYGVADGNIWQLEGESFYHKTADLGQAADLQPLDAVEFKMPEEDSFETDVYNLMIRACGYQNYTVFVNEKETGTLTKETTDWGSYGIYTVPGNFKLKKGDTLTVRADNNYGWVDFIRLVPCQPFEETEVLTGVTVTAEKGVVPFGAVLSAEEVDEDRLKEISSLFGFEEGQAPFMHFYEISLLMDGVPVQPAGELKISLPIDEEFDREKLSLYYISDDKKKTRLAFTINEAEGRIEFTTSHLSCYGLINVGLGTEYYYEGEHYYSQTAGGGKAADLQPEDSITFTLSDAPGFSGGNYRLSIAANGNRTKYIVKVNDVPIGVIGREAAGFGMEDMKESVLGEVLRLNEDDVITVYAPGTTQGGRPGPYGWVDYVKLKETDEKPDGQPKAKRKITLEAEDFYSDVLEEGGKVAKLDEPAKRLEIPILASMGFENKEYLFTMYTTGTMRSYKVLVNGTEAISGERSGSGYGMQYMTKETGDGLIALKPGDMLTIYFPEQDTDNYGNWIDRIVLDSTRKAPNRNMASRFGGRIANWAAEKLFQNYGPQTATENGKLIYQGEAYYTKQKDNPAADLQPGEQILIPVSDNGGFADGTYKLTIRSCGNREAFTIKVNGMAAGGISRKGTNYGMDSMTDDDMGKVMELKAGDILGIEGERGGRYGWIDYVTLNPVTHKEKETGRKPFTWQAEEFYRKQKDNPAADLQPEEEIQIPLGSNGSFQAGTYYIAVSSNGDRTALGVKVNGKLLGSITRNKTNFSMNGMTLDTLLRPVSLQKEDVITISAPGSEAEGPWGWVDKMLLIPAPSPEPKAQEEYRYPGQAYGKASMYLPAADLQPGESLEIPLSDNPDFMEGEYKLMVISNGTRQKFSVQLNHKAIGEILRKPSDYGDNGMSSDSLPQTLWLKPTDTITVTGQEGDAFGWVASLVLEQVK